MSLQGEVKGRMSVCEFMGMKDGDAKMMLGLDQASLSAKTEHTVHDKGFTAE